MKKPKVPVKTFVADEMVFRQNDDLRKELEVMLDSRIFQTAVKIVMDKRINAEQLTESLALGSSEVVSVRMNSQRVGMEGILLGMRELTKPIPTQQEQEQAAAFGADAAARKLLELGVSI